MNSLTYRDRKKKNEKRSWDNIKNKLKDDFVKLKVIATETYQGIKKQFNEEKSKKIIRNKQIDPNLELFCPFCKHTIPKELKPLITDSSSIVCENCGTEIKKNNFFEDYSFPD